MKRWGRFRIAGLGLVFSLLLVSFGAVADASDLSPPEGPSGIAGNGEASLTWSMVPGATSYVLYRGTTNGGPYIFAAQTQGTGYTDRTLANGSTYHYVVTALNAEGQSPNSAPVSVEPTAAVPAAPINLAAIPGNGAVSLVWDRVTSAVSYNVFRATSRGGPYVRLEPSAPGPCFTDTGLANGANYYYVVQTTQTAAGAYSDEVSARPSALLPSAPGNLTATPGSTWASLSWSGSAGATGYAVYRGTAPGGPYSFAGLSSTTTYEDTGLPNGKVYTYVVAAVNGNGRSAFSTEASVSVSAVERPRAPVLDAKKRADGQVSLYWDNAPGAVSYTVRRGTNPGGPYTAGFPVQGALYHVDQELANGTTYHYVVDAYNGSNEESSTVARSNEVGITPVPQAPPLTSLSVIPGNTEATVTWTPLPAIPMYWVSVHREEDGGYVTSGYSHGASFTATGLTNGEIYEMRVQSGSAESGPDFWSIPVAVGGVTPSALLPLSPNPNTFGIFASGNTELSLRWDEAPGATAYRVYRRMEESAWPPTPLSITPGTLFTDRGLQNGTDYHYIVSAVNENGEGAWALADRFDKPAANAPLAPTNPIAVPGNMQATITWNPVVGARDYWVAVATSPGGDSVTSGHSGGAPSFTATGLTNGATYYLRVQALADGSSSAFSAEVSVTPSAALPAAPSNLHLSAEGNTRLSIQWDEVPGATGYAVYRKSREEQWGSTPLTTVAGTLFSDGGLDNGKEYCYTVAALNGNGPGAWATPLYARPAATATLAPANVVVIAGNTQAAITWDPVVGATGYWVTVGTFPGGQDFASGHSGETSSFTATGLGNSRTYYFKVQVSSPSASAWSDVVSATTSSTPAGHGTISGRVAVDFAGYSGLGVRGATVSLEGTEYSAITDVNGYFTLPTVPFGDYRLIVTAADLETATLDVSLGEQDLTVTIPPMAVSKTECPDFKIGLESVIHMLQILTGVREP